MTNTTDEIQSIIEKLVDNISKLKLAMLVKETVDDLAGKMASNTPHDVVDAIRPIHEEFRHLWAQIMHEDIETPDARDRYRAMVARTNETLPGGYRIVNPEELLKQAED